MQNEKQRERKLHVHEQEIKQNVAQQQENLLEQEEQIECHLSRGALSRNSKKSEPFFFLLKHFSLTFDTNCKLEKIANNS